MAQTVTYDGGTPSRPIAVTGLVVNGITYDLTISYNIIYPFATSESGFPQGDVLLAGTLLQALLNKQGIDSDNTLIITAGKTTAGGAYSILEYKGRCGWLRRLGYPSKCEFILGRSDRRK